MKKLYTLLALVITLITFAQAPQGFNYQATVRNSSGALIVNQNVFFKFNIMLNSATSLPVFSETHMAPTDDLGHVNLVIGQGTATVGSFSTINWGNGSYYLGIELNTGSGYVAMGTTQLLSVPYALYANSAGNSQSSIPNLASVLAVNNGANNLQIKSLANPTDAQDLVTKSYLESQLASLQSQINNIPNVSIPVLTTNAISNINLVSASSGGNITTDGGTDITARGVVWSTSQNPTIALTTKTLDGVGLGSFTSSISGLTSNTTYYVRAYATNSAGTAYGNEISFITTSIQLPILTTRAILDITLSTATSGGNITFNGGASLTSRGVVWSTAPNPTVALSTKTINGSSTGTFTSNITGLAANTQYYVRAYATNVVGTAYGNELTFTTETNIYVAMYPTGTVFCNNVVTDVVDVVNPSTGKTWMDRNLGASRRGIEPPGMTDSQAYGDLYQWGRRADGHQCRTSGVTTTLSSTDQPSNGYFIISPDINITNFDWRSSPNNNLWQGVNGINNPCPNGYRIPTESELDSEISSWGPGSSAQPNSFTSPLNWTRGGSRFTTGEVLGTFGFYWSSTLIGSGSFYTAPSTLFFQSNITKSIQNDDRGRGLSVRCIKN